VRESIKLKKEALKGLVGPGVKAREWEESREAMEKDFHLASRRFSEIIRQPRKGKQSLPEAGGSA